MDNKLIIGQTKKWIVDVVAGCNFCPFALREVKKESIYFEVFEGSHVLTIKKLSAAFAKMEVQKEIETMFLILPKGFASFNAYLKLVERAEKLVKKTGYEGVYQIASFHPEYVFAGSAMDDAANYTNRSPYPMLHILREESVSLAIDNYPDAGKIPERNTAFARKKGLTYMQSLRAACLEISE